MSRWVWAVATAGVVSGCGATTDGGNGTRGTGDGGETSDAGPGSGGSAGSGASTGAASGATGETGAGGFAVGGEGGGSGAGGSGAGGGGAGGSSPGGAGGNSSGGQGAFPGTGAFPGAGAFPGVGADPDDIPPGPQLCGGVECEAGAECCLLDMTCFDPKTESCTYEGPPPPDFEGPFCTSNADCTPSQFCNAHSELCGGIGRCDERENCGGCFGSRCESCGCDGKTYPNFQTACLAGVRAVEGACGEVVTNEGAGGSANAPPRTLRRCGTDSDCGTDEACCALTAACYDPGVPELCQTPPEGTTFPCITDQQCPYVDQFCWGDGCEGPGGCTWPHDVECDGILDAVCGCDGNSYANRCWARKAGVRIASEGECPDE